MASTHALLSRNQWQGVRLATLVGNELAPYVGEGSTNVEGPEVLLSAEATQAMAIVLHELVTNASKHGALATAQGRVSVQWDWEQAEDGPRRLVLHWRETGGIQPVVQGQAGYGIRAIRELIPYELDGSVDLVFDADGVRCRIALPLQRERSGIQTVQLFKAAISLPAAECAQAQPQ
ncbi:MAG: sensor histidine kinase [Rhodospirillales bacterium]|nr:sensor histidine kinase [Rhodospirillales bacterium]